MIKLFLFLKEVGVRKIVLMCALILALGANDAKEVEKGLLLNKSFEIIDFIKPEFLWTQISIVSSSKLRNIGELSQANRAKITENLNDIIQEAKKSDICKGGGYSINPIISYKENSRKTIGQELNFNLNCKFKENNLAQYNELLATINAKISKNDLLSLPQPRLDSRITQEEISSKKEEIFMEFLKTIPNLEREYGAILNKQCKVVKVSAQDSFAPSPMPRIQMEEQMVNLSAAKDSTHTKAPIADEVSVNANLLVNFRCE